MRLTIAGSLGPVGREVAKEGQREADQAALGSSGQGYKGAEVMLGLPHA